MRRRPRSARSFRGRSAKKTTRRKNIFRHSFSKRRSVPKRPARKRRIAKRAPITVRMAASREAPLLETLTGSPARARLLRLLLREPQLAFAVRDAAERIGMPPPLIRREAETLEKLGLLQGGKRGHRLRVAATFPFAAELRTLAIQSFPISRQELVRILARAGKLRLVLASGVFLNLPRTRVDLFVVANRLSERKLEAAVRRIEQIVGAEIRWAGMDTREFSYRFRMFDRFVRDILTETGERVVENVKL